MIASKKHLALLASAVGVALASAPASAGAAVTCAYNGGTQELEVTVTDGFATSLVRDGSSIKVQASGNPQCTGSPTITSVEKVVVNDQSVAAQITSSTISLLGGVFAPGFPDEGSSSEIEFEFNGIERVDVQGSAGAESIRFGSTGANLNPHQEAGVSILSDIDATFTGLESARVFGSGGTDFVSGEAAAVGDQSFPLPLTIFGNDGDDELTGGAADDTIGAPSETDDDTLAGGAGDDRFSAFAGNDAVDGGPGVDTASYAGGGAPVTVDLAVTAPQGTGGGGLDSLTETENLLGSPHGDILRGDDGPNRLEGLQGGDLIDGRGGEDRVLGDTVFVPPFGDDTLLVRDGATDTVSCLEGLDSVTADQAGVDLIASDCETLSFPALPVPATPADARNSAKKCKKKRKRAGTGAKGAKRKRCKRKRRKK